MSKTITINKELKFEQGDRVRVVTSDSPFWWWTGTVHAGMKGDLELGVHHYLVHLDGLTSLNPSPLLFREMQLAYAL